MKSPATGPERWKFLGSNLVIIALINGPLILILLSDLVIQNRAATELGQALGAAVAGNIGAKGSVEVANLVSSQIVYSTTGSLRVDAIQPSARITVYRAVATPKCLLLTYLDPAISVHASQIASPQAE